MPKTADELRALLLQRCTARSRALDAAGSTTQLLEAGEGPPLVLVHGAIECGGITWVPVIDELAKRYRVIVPDVPGLGASTPLARMDMPGFTERLKAVIADTCREPPILVVHSMVGSVGAKFAAQNS